MTLKPRTVDFAKIWISLKDTVMRLVTFSSVTQATWAATFSDVYALCVAFPDSLADKLYAETKILLESHVKHLYSQVLLHHEEDILEEYYRYWLQFSEGVKWLNSLYSYLNTQHIQKSKISDADLAYGSIQVETNEQLLEIGELGLEIWQREMVLPIQSTIVQLLLQEIHTHRMTQSTKVPASTVRGVIHSFVEVNSYKKINTLQLYETIFEEKLLRETAEYYTSEASSLLQVCDVSQYMEKVIIRLKEEELRAIKFLPASSHQSVVNKVREKMISNHLATIHENSKSMVTQEKVQDLSNVYMLLKPLLPFSQYLGPFVRDVQDHIKQECFMAVSQLRGENVPMQFVEGLLEVHCKYRSMIKELFHNDQQFVGALDRAFETVVNYRPTSKNVCRSPELLTKYCDLLLKKSTKGLTESEVDDKLTLSVTIFKYIEDKDMFQKFYSRMLAKRLIHQQSQSMYSEEAMINRLKQACGYEFTSKLHRMYTDMSLSGGLNQKFNEFMQNEEDELGINFSIVVLQAGAWPLAQTPVSPFSLPQELEKSVQMFEKFYYKSFNGRKLTWLHHLCQGELKVNYTKRTYLITMSTYQMAMLLLFEKVDTVTCEELQLHTRLNNEQFIRFLQPLIDSKILMTKAEELTPEATVTLNFDYTNKRTKFKIFVASTKETQQETEQTHTEVDEDRKLYLQATIVRVMKARKIIKHNVLIQEVISQARTRFVPQIPMIKKCIELLIDKQYMERTPNSTDEYSYIA